MNVLIKIKPRFRKHLSLVLLVFVSHAWAQSPVYTTRCAKAYQAKQYQKAYIICQKQADEGNVEAQGFLASIYELGRVGTKNYNKAFHWFKTAALKNYPVAQTNLGRMYMQGRGTSRNLAKSLFWFKKAAENGLSLIHI